MIISGSEESLNLHRLHCGSFKNSSSYMYGNAKLVMDFDYEMKIDSNS